MLTICNQDYFLNHVERLLISNSIYLFKRSISSPENRRKSHLINM